MDDLDPRERIAEPTDQWIADLIRRVRGLPPSAPLSPAIIAAVRAHLRQIARRRIVARRDRGEPLAATALDIGDDAREAVREVLLDLVASPHGQAGLYALLAMPIVLDAAVVGLVRRVRPSARHDAAPARAYLVAKVGGDPWPAASGARRPAIYGSDGHRIPTRSPSELGPTPWQTAACNAVSPSRARDWLRRLDTGSDAERRVALGEMAEVGAAAAIQHAPLPLWHPEPGP